MQQAIAVSIGTTRLSYDEFERDQAMMGQWLREHLADTEVRVAVYLKDMYWHWVVVLALLRLGKCCASVSQFQHVPPAEVTQFQVWLSDEPVTVNARVQLCATNEWEACRAACPGVTVPTEQSVRGLHLAWPATAQRWLFTSGTTGRPKVVVIPAAALRARLMAAATHYGQDVSAATRLLSLMGLDTVGGCVATLLTWVRGGEVLLGVPEPAGRGSRGYDMLRSNLLTASPAILQALMQQTQGVWAGRAERIVRVGGSRLHSRVRDAALARLGHRVQSTYGATEVGLMVSCDAQRQDEALGLAGRVLPQVSLEVVDDHEQPLPPGQTGRIRCRTPGMALGYLGDTAPAQFRQGWFYPGDLGYLTADGWLVLSGRDSSVINVGGVKISAEDMEARLLHVPQLQDVCVLGLDGASDGTQLLVVAVLQDAPQMAPADLDALRQALREAGRLPLRFKLVCVPQLPRNAMGKLPRAVIAQQVMKVLAKQQPV